MPMIALALRGAALTALLASPLAAQTTTVDVQTTSGIAVTVPYLTGADHPDAFAPTRRGAVGRPRSFARLYIELLVDAACTEHAAFGESPAIRCSSGVLYQALVSSDADPAFSLPIGATLAPTARHDGLVAITAQRLTVDY
jgi:hypothetical protein